MLKYVILEYLNVNINYNTNFKSGDQKETVLSETLMYSIVYHTIIGV